MKNLKPIYLVFITAFLLSSCVSSRKYDEAILDKANLEQFYSIQLIENDRLKTENNTVLNDNKDLRIENSVLRKEGEQWRSTSHDERVLLNDSEQTLITEEKQMEDMKALLDENWRLLNGLKEKMLSAFKNFDFTDDEFQINVRDGKLYVTMADNFLFPLGSDALNTRSEGAIIQIEDVIYSSDLVNDLEIAVEGHTDSIYIDNDRYKDNLHLSLDRAFSIARVFIREGILPEHVFICGEKKYHAVDNNETVQGHQIWRGTEIVIAPQLFKLTNLTKEFGVASYMNKQ